jgi:hypothetical protein
VSLPASWTVPAAWRHSTADHDKKGCGGQEMIAALAESAMKVVAETPVFPSQRWPSAAV